MPIKPRLKFAFLCLSLEHAYAELRTALATDKRARTGKIGAKIRKCHSDLVSYLHADQTITDRDWDPFPLARTAFSQDLP